MRFITSSSFLSIIASIASLASAETPSEVVQLSKESHDDFLKNNNVTLIEYFAPWCGHCQRLEPEYKKAALMLKEHGIRLANINCDEKENKEFCNDLGIRGYPTLKIFNNGNKDDYEGPRDADGIFKYMKKYFYIGIIV